MPPKDRHRGTLACARCYQLKKKCDKRTPSCSRCLQARQPCTSINRQKGVEVPRSIARYLEQLDAELVNHSSQDSPLSAHYSTHFSDQNAKLMPSDYSSDSRQLSSYVIRRGTLALRCRHTTSLLNGHCTIHYRNRLFYGSERPPLKIYVGVHQEDPYQIPNCLLKPVVPNSEPLKVPVDVATLLLNVYIENILPRYPCFIEADLRNHFYAVYQGQNSDGTKPSDSSRFIIAMVLAISSLTSKAYDFRKVAFLSQSLHRDALQHSSFLHKTSVRTLQCFFLLIQLALLLPHTGNLWYMTGEAMRMVVSLGLHVENQQLVDSRLADLRRRLFWTAYTLERSTSITSGCPLAICDEQISTKLPFGYEDDCLEINRLDSTKPHDPKKTHFLDHIQLRQLQTKVHMVQFFGYALTDSATNYDDWVLLMDMQIQNLHEKTLSIDGMTVDWFTNAVRHMRLMLHRPCPRNPTPSSVSIKAALTAAVGIAHGSWDLIQGGYLIFPFNNVYNTFQAGLVMLYALKHHFQIVSANSLHSEIMEALDLISRLFSSLAIRWAPAIDTYHYFTELRDGILRNIASMSQLEGSVQNIDLLAELDHLVTKRGVGALSCLNMSGNYSQAIELTSSPDFDLTLDESWKDFLDFGFGFDITGSAPIEDSAGIITPVPIPSTSQDISLQDSENTTTAKTILNLSNVIESLPACNFCRNRRTKCNRGLPSCSTCTNERKECLYYDAILEQNISRSYIHTLYTRIKNVADVQVYSHHDDSQPTPATPTLSVTTQHIFLPLPKTSPTSTPLELNDKTHCLDSAYFGPSSALSALNTTILITSEWSDDDDNNVDFIGDNATCFDNSIAAQGIEAVLPPLSSATALVKLFTQSVNIFYPTIHSQALDEMHLAAYNFPASFANSPEERIFNLVIAIALQLTQQDDTTVDFTPAAYFRKATYGHSSSTSQVLLLQENLLICIYLLLSPGSGDIWRILGLSVRVYFDMTHRPSDNEDPDQQLAVVLSRTLYCLESQVAIAYGRPSLLSISDTLRDDMTSNFSGSVPELISIHFYKISFMKLQILNQILSSTPKNPHSENNELSKVWHDEWERDLKSVITAELLDQDISLSQLKAWGEMVYCEISLLMLKLDSSTTANTTIGNYTTFFNACSAIRRHNMHSTSKYLSVNEISRDGSFIFPLTWTTSHTIFSALLQLFTTTKKRELMVSNCVGRASTIRRGMNLLASLESDANNLSSGFSEILDKFCTLEE